MPLQLNVIVASTRPGRIGISIGRWFHAVAAADAGFEARLVDLAEFKLPVYDEPRHPRLRQYEHAHTRAWSASVDAADAFVFVTPEYNHGPTPALVNALDFVFQEWGYKPVAFVSYGGVSGGLRAVQAIKLQLPVLRLVPIPEAVVVPMVAQQVKDGVFTPKDAQVEAAAALLKELARWAEALRPLRARKS